MNKMNKKYKKTHTTKIHKKCKPLVELWLLFPIFLILSLLLFDMFG